MKNIFKATLAVAAIAAVGMGAYKTYSSYVAANMSEEDLLLAENIEAMAAGDNLSGQPVRVQAEKLGYCWKHFTNYDAQCSTTAGCYPITVGWKKTDENLRYRCFTMPVERLIEDIKNGRKWTPSSPEDEICDGKISWSAPEKTKTTHSYRKCPCNN